MSDEITVTIVRVHGPRGLTYGVRFPHAINYGLPTLSSVADCIDAELYHIGFWRRPQAAAYFWLGAKGEA